MSKVRQLWEDESGSLNAAELILLATLLVIGLVPGVAILRDAVLEEMADTAQAISAYDVGHGDNGHRPKHRHRSGCVSTYGGPKLRDSEGR